MVGHSMSMRTPRTPETQAPSQSSIQPSSMLIPMGVECTLGPLPFLFISGYSAYGADAPPLAADRGFWLLAFVAGAKSHCRSSPPHWCGLVSLDSTLLCAIWVGWARGGDVPTSFATCVNVVARRPGRATGRNHQWPMSRQLLTVRAHHFRI